ncbi:MAG: ergothioneine biosynthesis protein EgtB [Acidobacteriota bacterium]
MGCPFGEELVDELQRTRERTRALLEPLPEEALRQQLRGFLSPLVWDLGHIANFEEQWLVRAVGGEGLRPDMDRLYNPFEQPRARRASLALPSVAETLAYLAAVRQRSLELLGRLTPDPADPLLGNGYLYRMVLQHEAQHQETMLQALDIPEKGWAYPMVNLAGEEEAGGGAGGDAASGAERRDRPLHGDDSIEIPAGAFEMGTDDRSRAYDNERCRHRVELPAFSIERFPVTVQRWQQFIADAGYRREDLWSTEGWAWQQQTGCQHPQGWLPDGEGSWRVCRLGHRQPLVAGEPVQHVSYWEAEAFARWAGARLPTEAGWEKAAAWDPRAGVSRTYPWGEQPATGQLANLGGNSWAPAAVGSYPLGSSAYGVAQLLGDVYEWTSSSFEPYPGFQAFPYRRYSEVFFGGPYRVLRGASWATHPLVARNSYRNWDLPCRRQIFAGVRLVGDLD